MVLALVVLTALAIAAVTALARPSVPSAFVLAALCGIWLPINNTRLEGPVLWTFDTSRGLTVADLASVTGAVIAAVTVLRWSRRSQRCESPDARRPAWMAAATVLLGLVVVLGTAATYTWMNQPT